MGLLVFYIVLGKLILTLDLMKIYLFWVVLGVALVIIMYHCSPVPLKTAGYY